jgi:Co/Zn/Cd efflux system component
MSSHLIRSDLVPILGGYVILMVVLAVGLRTQRRRAAAGLPITRLTGRRDHGWRALILHVLTDAVAGYLVLMAVVVLYYYGVARVGSNFLESAFTGTALLLALALPLFIAASWLTERRTQRRTQRATRPPTPARGPHDE